MYKIKNHFREWYHPQGAFMLRNPLFPVETFFNWESGSNMHAEASKEALREALREFYQQPIAKEALYIASPDLHEQLLRWLDHSIENPKNKEKLELSLVKYMIRMCTRCTPFGLFASCTSGNISDTNAIHLNGKNRLQRSGRLDMDYVCQVLSYVLKQKEMSDQLRFYPNSSLYRLGDKWRYIEHRFLEQTGRSYHLVQIEQSTYLEKIVQLARKGATPAELAAIITEDEISSEEAIEFIYELILSQVLISELEPHVTGEEYFSFLLHKLKLLQHTENFITQFDKVVSAFAQIKIPEDAAKNEFYPQIVSHLQQLPVPVHLKTLIQVDSYRPASTCTLSKKVMDEILGGASLLHHLAPDDTSYDSFSDFKNAFSLRYESQWVPLVEVLDTESGIGYGKFATSGMEESPLIDKLPIGGSPLAANTVQQYDAETFKWQLYQEAITQEKVEVILDDKMLEQLSKKETTITGLPDSMYMMIRINAHSAEDIDKGNYKLSLQSPSGPSGGNLLGRFCHLHPDIENLTKTILQQEEAHHPDCIYAEIVHLPESRIGNILMRPTLRAYEIPYLCGSTLNDEHQVPVTDLLVGIQENKVILHSKRLNKQVVPRMTTAHNFSMTTLPVYQFLCDLQHQHIGHIGWQWGILEHRPFLPRVSYGKYILSKARWILTKEDIKGCDKKSDEELLLKFSEVVKKKNLPSYVLLSQADNELLLHLQNIFCIKLLLSEVNKSGAVRLIESLDMPDQCWIESPEGHHAGEFIVAFNRNSIDAAPAITHATDQQKIYNVKRYFPVGSEWLYAKIYCGTKTAEKVLCDVLKPLTEELLSEQRIDRFFFLRYHDHGNHIRIRFRHADHQGFWKDVMHRIQHDLHPYMHHHTVHNLQFETYQREIERYGSDTMDLSEAIFYHQSVAILNFIAMLDGDEGEQYRWQVTLKAIDFFLDDFQYTTEQKLDLVKILQESFSGEFKIGAPEQKKISERFNLSKSLIQQLMSDAWEEDENLRKAIRTFKSSDKDYRKTIEEILSSPSIHYDIQPLHRLMSSYLHMFINRMFVSNQRKVELVIYNYLLKYYESKMAREKKQKISLVPAISSY